MRPGTLGRALGIGARLAAKQILPTPPAPPTPAEQQAQRIAQQTRSTARIERAHAAGRHTRNLGKGSKRFAGALWNPFAHAGSILWLEVTGMFFALFAFLFAQHLWTLRTAWRSGPQHAHFLAYSAFSLVFTWFATSSFLRVRTRNRRR
jgi:hypothetical protein